MALQATKSTSKKWDMALYRFNSSEDKQSFINYINKNIPCEQIDNYTVRAPREIDQFWLSATGNFDTTSKSIDWHRLTKFRHIAEVYENDRRLFDTWKKQGLIPGWALNKVMNNAKSR